MEGTGKTLRVSFLTPEGDTRDTRDTRKGGGHGRGIIGKPTTSGMQTWNPVLAMLSHTDLTRPPEKPCTSYTKTTPAVDARGLGTVYTVSAASPAPRVSTAPESASARDASVATASAGQEPGGQQDLAAIF